MIDPLGLHGGQDLFRESLFTFLPWVTQIHKDGAFILGWFLCLYGWLSVIQGSQHFPKSAWKKVCSGVALASLGLALIWVVRPYPLWLGALANLGVLALVGARWAVTAGQGLGWWLCGASSVFVVLVGAGAGRMARGEPGAAELQTVDGQSWASTPALPLPLEAAAHRLAATRARYLDLYRGARSNIDPGVSLGNLQATVGYAPRALQIAGWAPFPSEWFRPGSTGWTTFGRRVAGVEMLAVYVGTALLPFAMWKWRRRFEFWFLLLACLGALTALGLAVPNMGALYRFRYGFLMAIVALGYGGVMELLAGKSPAAKALPFTEVEGRHRGVGQKFPVGSLTEV